MVKPALMEAVVANSQGTAWDEARLEWQITWSTSEPNDPGTCVCDKQGIVDKFAIHNVVTNAELYPIGNECIKLFERADFDERSRLHMDLRRCQTMIADNDGFLTIKGVSKRVIQAAGQAGVFDQRETDFMDQMKKQRSPRSPKQESWMQSLLNRLSQRVDDILDLPSA